MEFNMRVQGLSRFRRAVVIGAAAALAVGVAGCSNSEEASSESSTTAASSQTRVFEAQNGSIEIPSDPQRIVACGYAVLPLIQAGANLAAVCEWTRELGNMDDKTKAAYEALPKVAPDGNVSQLNYEGIVAAEPDLIIMGVPARVESQLDMAQLKAAAPVVFLGPTVPADWRVLGEQFADAANVSDTYGEFKDDYDAKTAELAAKYKDKLGALTFGGVCNVCKPEAGTFSREYASSYTTNLFDGLGLQFPGTPADPADIHVEQVSIEKIGENLGNVDVIVYGLNADGSMSPQLQELVNSELWKELPAVKAGNVVQVRHSLAATYQTALLTLDSIDEGLSKLPANQ